MKLKFKTFLHRFARGVTLVEVMLGVGLLGGLLVALLYTSSKLNAHSRLARQCVEACDVADTMLLEMISKGDIKYPDSGQVAGHPDWRWEISLCNKKAPEEFRSEIVSFRLTEAVLNKELVRVELLVPTNEEDEQNP